MFQHLLSWLFTFLGLSAFDHSYVFEVYIILHLLWLRDFLLNQHTLIEKLWVVSLWLFSVVERIICGVHKVHRITFFWIESSEIIRTCSIWHYLVFARLDATEGDSLRMHRMLCLLLFIWTGEVMCISWTLWEILTFDNISVIEASWVLCSDLFIRFDQSFIFIGADVPLCDFFDIGALRPIVELFRSSWTGLLFENQDTVSEWSLL